MAKMNFFKYRQRHAVEPTDDELNFSVIQAKTDLQFEHGAVTLLNDIEAHFREKGFWSDSSPAKETRRSDVKSERWTIARALKSLEARMEALESEVFKRSASSIDESIIHDKTDTMSFEKLRRLNSALRRSIHDKTYTMNIGIVQNKIDVVTPEENKKLVPFRVHVPHPLDDAKVHHSVVIYVEARVENESEILTPDALAMIERVRAEELQILKDKIGNCQLNAVRLGQEAKQITDPIAELLPT
jgi:hypothetical protein